MFICIFIQNSSIIHIYKVLILTRQYFYKKTGSFLSNKARLIIFL